MQLYIAISFNLSSMHLEASLLSLFGLDAQKNHTSVHEVFPKFKNIDHYKVKSTSHKLTLLLRI